MDRQDSPESTPTPLDGARGSRVEWTGRWLPAGAVVALLWTFVVTAAYYVAHKPFTASNLAAVGRSLAGLGGMGLVVALGTGAGVLLLRRLDLAPAERLVWAAAVGVAVEGLRGLPRLPLDLGWLARVLVVLVILLNLAEVGLAWVREGPVRVLLGFESREEYLDRRLGWYHVAVESINRTLPPDATVLFLWEPRSYFCAVDAPGTGAASLEYVDCQPDALLDRWLHTTHLYGHDADAIARAWQADGITHVLLYRAGYRAIVEAGFDPVTPRDVATLQDLEARHLSPAGEWGDAYTLFELVP